MRNSVPTPNATHERLSAALRAQASVLGAESPRAPAPHRRSASAVSPGREPVQVKPRLSALTVLALAVLLGAMTGGLAGVISAW